MKKIGIITLMHGFNYGGMLQCYALQQTLRELGNETEVIDYPMSPRRRQLRRISGCLGDAGARQLEKLVWQLRPERKLFQKFEQFRRQDLKLSKRINTPSELAGLSKKYDKIVVGSDQVWNQSWYTPEYFLRFAAPEVQKISYAACCGAAALVPPERRPELVRALGDFDRISVRNEMTRDFVRDLTGAVPDIVADPTVLPTWRSYAKPPAIPYSNYILWYAMSRDSYDRNRQHILRLAAELALPLVIVRSDVLQPWLSEPGHFEWRNPDIFDWIGAFEHADYVFTDSFHGSIFAALNRKPLWNYIGRQHSFERVAYIANRYQLLAAYCQPEEVISSLASQQQSPYYDAVHHALAVHRQFSLGWLRQAICD